MADMHVAAQKAWVKRREVYGKSGISNPKRGSDPAKKLGIKEDSYMDQQEFLEKN